MGFSAFEVEWSSIQGRIGSTRKRSHDAMEHAEESDEEEQRGGRRVFGQHDSPKSAQKEEGPASSVDASLIDPQEAKYHALSEKVMLFARGKKRERIQPTDESIDNPNIAPKEKESFPKKSRKKARVDTPAPDDKAGEKQSKKAKRKQQRSQRQETALQKEDEEINAFLTSL